jgi:hypothetical protein
VPSPLTPSLRTILKPSLPNNLWKHPVMSKPLDLIDRESLYSKEIEKAKKFLENKKIVANGRE